MTRLAKSALLVVMMACAMSAAGATSWRHRGEFLEEEAKFAALVERMVNMGTAELARDITTSGLAQVVHFPARTSESRMSHQSGGRASAQSTTQPPYRPLIQMHGMGDCADNPLGMEPMAKALSQYLNGTFVYNVAIGDSCFADMVNSFLMVMDKQVDSFAATVKSNANFSQGFNAIGYSQGNLIIRGYIEKYNDPPVYNWVSMHGPLVGVASIPNCNLTSLSCRALSSALGNLAYTKAVQGILAQADYFRQPLEIPKYLEFDTFLAEINNEHQQTNSNFSTNFEDVERMAFVKALGDTVVWPNDSEWWGYYADGSMTNILQMENTTWYANNLFGLRTVAERKAIDWYTTPGNHLQFTQQFLFQLADTYFRN